MNIWHMFPHILHSGEAHDQPCNYSGVLRPGEARNVPEFRLNIVPTVIGQKHEWDPKRLDAPRGRGDLFLPR